MRVLAAVLALLLLPLPALALVGPPQVDLPVRLVKLQQVASGLSLPLGAVNAGDGSGRLFIVEQVGLVHVLRNGALSGPWLDVRGKVACCGEQGLLGLAFYPDFAQTGRVVISYTRAGDGASVLERLTLSDPASGNAPSSGEVLLVQGQPFANHNGGNIAFGPLDHFLYLGLGDGGAGGDPYGNGQNPATLLGKMLRIDVDVPHGYAIPPTNPCAVTHLCKPEIWSMGLRNPWRWSFDSLTGDLWLGDVGQNAWEEVDYQPATVALPAPLNYGWNCWEGNHAYASCLGLGPSQGVLTFPVVEYNHGQGCSIIGGYVYRGTAVPALNGAYLYGDLCSQRVWGALGEGRARVPSLLLTSGQTITSFGEDEQHELYLVGYNGSVHRFVAA